MQNYKYDKAMGPESRNGGTAALNNNNGTSNCRRVLLIFLDVFCLIVEMEYHEELIQFPDKQKSEEGIMISRFDFTEQYLNFKKTYL